MKKVNLFCAKCNIIQPFEVGIDLNGEYELTCSECSHIVKFPADCKLADAISKHNENNIERVIVDPESGVPKPSQAQMKQIEAALKAHG